MWRAAARNLSLSDAQKKALCQLRQLFLQKQEALISQRVDSIGILQQTIPNVASSHDIAAKFLQASNPIGKPVVCAGPDLESDPSHPQYFDL